MENKWIGKRLGLLRRVNKLTQEQTSKNIGIKYRTLQDLEAGKHVTLKNIKILVNFYLCSKSWLLTGDGDPFPEKPGMFLDIQTVKLLRSDSNFEPVVELFSTDAIFKEENEAFGLAVANLKEIFDSKDEILISAIMANLHSFRRAVRREKENQELKRKINALEGRLAALEDKLSRGDQAGGPAADPDTTLPLATGTTGT